MPTYLATGGLTIVICMMAADDNHIDADMLVCALYKTEEDSIQHLKHKSHFVFSSLVDSDQTSRHGWSRISGKQWA